MKVLRRTLILAAAMLGAVCGLALAGCDEVASHTHQYEWKETKPATCTVPGERTGTCTVPGCDEVMTEPIPALGHDRVETTETTASCTQKGLVRITCSRCSELNETREVPMLNHIWQDVTTTVATCEEPSISDQKCRLCGKTRQIENSPKLGHDWVNGEVIQEATCTVDGSRHAKCDRCGKEDVITIEAPGHNWQNVQIKRQPTCYQEGISESRCLRCGITDDVEIEKLPHTWDSDYTIDKVPTFDEPGEKSVHCLVPECGATKETVVIPKLVEGTLTEYEFRLVRGSGTRLSYTGGTITLFDQTDTQVAMGSFVNGVFKKSLLPAAYRAVLSGFPEDFEYTESTEVQTGAPRTNFVIKTAVVPNPPTSGRIREGDLACDFSFTTTENVTHTLSEMCAKYSLVMINFWATWCGPCQSEFPGLSRAYTTYKDDVYVIALSTEPTDTLEKIASYKSSGRYSFDMGRDDAHMYNYYNSEGAIPLTVFVDSEGLVIYRDVGAQPQNFFEGYFAQYARTNTNPTNAAEKVLARTEYLPSKEEI